MPDVVIFHPVGNGDLALKPGASPAEALTRLERDPDTALLERRLDHTNAEAGPLPSAIDTLAKLGYTVRRVELFVTRQTPPDPGDTASWAPVLADAITRLDALNLNNHPITVTITTVTQFSIEGFADAARERAAAASENVVIPIASGAKTSFVGLLVGAINAGSVPHVVPVGKGDSPGTLSALIELDLVRWLTRRRMWAAIASLPDAPDHIREAALDLDRYERHEKVTGADLPADHVQRLIATTVSQWAADEPLWLTGLIGIIDKVTQRLVDQLPPADRANVQAQVEEWRRNIRTLPKGSDLHDADIALKVARQHPPRWKAWRNAPDGLKGWVDSYAILPQTNRARHGKLDDAQVVDRRADTQAYRTLVAISRGIQPPLRQAVEDPIPPRALEGLAAGLPDSPLPGARLAVRLAGERNASGVIDRQIDQHHLASTTRAEIPLPVLVVASADTAVDDAIIVSPHQLDDAATTTLTAVRHHCTEVELRHDCRITTIALYLNQGTKIMNFAALRTALTVASEIGAQLQLFDVAATGGGTSRITSLRTGDVRTLARRSLPTQQVHLLLHTAIRTLDLVQAQRLTDLLDDRDLANDVKALARHMLWPVADVGEDDWAARISAIAPAFNALIRYREVIGDRETVARMSTLLSAAVATKVDGGWGEGWDDSEGPLHDLWKARNAVFHDKRFTYPSDLTRDRLIHLAKHLHIRLNPSTIMWDTAIDKRKALLRKLDASVQT